MCLFITSQTTLATSFLTTHPYGFFNAANIPINNSVNHTQHICRFTNLPFISQLANICVSPCPVHLVSNVQRHECRNCTFGLEHQRWENIFVNTNEVSNKQNKRAKAHKRMGDEKTSSKFKSRKRLILVFEFAFRAV